MWACSVPQGQCTGGPSSKIKANKTMHGSKEDAERCILKYQQFLEKEKECQQENALEQR